MARRNPNQPTLPELNITQEDLNNLTKPISPSHGFAIAFWFLGKVDDPEYARTLLEIAINATGKLKALAQSKTAEPNTNPATSGK